MIEPEDLRVDVFSTGGPVNQHPTAVRITHIPTGTVVTCGDHGTQLRNKAEALRILRERLGETDPDPDPDEHELMIRILNLPVKHHDMTVGEYLTNLAMSAVYGDINSKYGFTGESDWRSDLYDALADGRILERNRDGDVNIHKAEELLADALFYAVRRPA